MFLLTDSIQSSQKLIRPIDGKWFGLNCSALNYAHTEQRVAKGGSGQ